MEFRLLGDLEVVDGGRRLPLGGRKQRALLAALLLDANRVVNSDVLIAALWGDEASPKAPGNLHALVSRLRRALGAARIERHAGGYLLRVQDSEVDLHRFERLRAEARLLPPAAASERLRLALDLWRGSALADFAYDSWAGNEIQRLEELRLAAVEERVEADLESGRHSELVGEVQGLVAEHPLREKFRRQLIVALYRSGRQAEALEAYRQAQKMLDEELGLEPSPALRELEGAVLRQDPALDAPKVLIRAGAPALPGHRTRLWLVAASALLAFGTAAGTVWLLNRDEGRRTVASAATPQPTSRTTLSVPQHKRVKAKPKVVVRTIRQPTRRKVATPRAQPVVRRSSTAERPVRKTVSRPAPKHRRTRTTPRPQPPPPPPAIVRIADNFDDGVMARDVWQETLLGTGVTVAERNGRLEIELAPTAVGSSQFLGAYWTKCKFFGDFDVRVEYELLDWPVGSGVTLELTAGFGSSAVAAARQSSPWGENYAAWHRNLGSGALPTTDLRGQLRLRRQDDQVFTYYREGTAWGALRNFRAAAPATLGVLAWSTNETFADQLVHLAFDNFEAKASSRPSC